MLKRNAQQRRRHILENLNETGEVFVEQLAAMLETSEVTIRKDLAALEKNGLLLRRYGGAIPLPKEIIHTGKVSNRKLSIAKAASELIRDHNRIIIDSGQTTGCLLPELARKTGLIVMTNSLPVANAILELENEPTLLMTGGTWDSQSEAFQGQQAEQVLRAYDFDQLFIGADGLDAQRGTTTFNELYSLSRVMAEVSREVIVLAEHEKFSRKIPNLELPWEQVDYLITDTLLTTEQQNLLEQQQVKILVAQPEN